MVESTHINNAWCMKSFSFAGQFDVRLIEERPSDFIVSERIVRSLPARRRVSRTKKEELRGRNRKGGPLLISRLVAPHGQADQLHLFGQKKGVKLELVKRYKVNVLTKIS